MIGRAARLKEEAAVVSISTRIFPTTGRKKHFNFSGTIFFKPMILVLSRRVIGLLWILIYEKGSVTSIYDDKKLKKRKSDS